MAGAALYTYDEVLYTGYPYNQTHPDRLATLATLHGLEPARVESCRVLELGCGDGGNIIPMAMGLPSSRFVGVDLSERAIANGTSLVGELGLANVSLLQLDVSLISEEMGAFDYIIAHGLYSWVPPDVQEKILAICKASLSPQGVAYVSYNTYPGSHLRNMTREMMLFHARHLREPERRVDRARAFVDFLSAAQRDSDVYGLFLQSESGRLSRLTDEMLYHDDLAEMNSPVYFHEFIERAGGNGLQYLSEADFFEVEDGDLSPRLAELLGSLDSSDVVTREQYMDFIKCRKFRQTLLVHDRLTIDRSLKADRANALYVASAVRPVSQAPGIVSQAVEQFRSERGASITTDHPLVKSALMELGRAWPGAIRFDRLLAAARDRLDRGAGSSAGAPEDAPVLGQFLLKTFAAAVVELHVHVPAVALELSERPVASPLARLQARVGPVVTSLFHTSVRIGNELGRYLLTLLDGTRDRAALLDELTSRIESRGQETGRDKGPPEEREEEREGARDFLDRNLDENLRRMATLGLLVA
ncbi:MAG TPA: class I SAM-dependent methyltransferase [Blastocatellia bacterium]|jgi:methyltransferase-like protein/trans-aconitate methyltransferase|nr:class I SAM-dependent methyltransferase [Blastocatellia bacterium]